MRMDWETRERPGRCAEPAEGGGRGVRRAGAAGQLWAGMNQRWTERELSRYKAQIVRGPGQVGHLAQYTCRNSPTDDLLGLGPDEVLLLGGQNAQGELLARPALPVHHVCALVHVDGALWEGCGLQEEGRAGVTLGAEGTSLSPQVLPDPLGFSISTGASQLCRPPCHAEHGGGLPQSGPHSPASY